MTRPPDDPSPRSPLPPSADPPLMRSLGEFVGHIYQAIRTDVTPTSTSSTPTSTPAPTTRRIADETRTLTDPTTGEVRVQRVLIEETIYTPPPANPPPTHPRNPE